CGDGKCTGGETPTTCSTDCPCTMVPDDCTGSTICIAGACVAAFPRQYTITDIHVMLPPLDPDGLPWDEFDGSAPDMFLATAAGDRLSTTVDDSYSATFSGPLYETLD